MKTFTGTPPCPNHGCEMEPTGDPRRWRCPRSGWIFEADADTDERGQKVQRTLSGELATVWAIHKVDGTGKGTP